VNYSKREIVRMLQCSVCQRYGVPSVARLRNTLQGRVWLPRTVAVYVLTAERISSRDVAAILRIPVLAVHDLLVLMAVQMEENRGIKREVGLCLEAADLSFGELEPF